MKSISGCPIAQNCGLSPIVLLKRPQNRGLSPIVRPIVPVMSDQVSMPMNASRRIVLIALTCLLCSACQLFDPTVKKYETMFEHQKMIIDPYSPEHAARHGPGFGITMEPNEARRVNAPNSAEFKAMLEEQLTKERLLGNDYCPYGYDIVKTLYFKHWYTEFWVDCRPALSP